MDVVPIVIFLNGTSSSGKTSISKKIQEFSNLPFIHFEIDLFLSMIKYEHIDCEEIDGVNDNCKKLISGFHHCFGSMANAGNNLIIDHVLQEPDWLIECLSILRNMKVYFVGVHCSITSLINREQIRSDRPLGLATLQFNKVHLHDIYDIEVNTDNHSAEQCAKQILEFINQENSPMAWTKLIKKYNIS